MSDWNAGRDPDAELAQRLLERRIVLVTGELTHERATAAAATLMLLDASGDDPIELHVSCPDGDLDAAGALADTIDLVGVPVVARCRGRVGGPAIGPVVAADRRVANRSCLFVLRDPDVRMNGRAAELQTMVDAHQRQLATLHRRVADACGRPYEHVEADWQHGVLLGADEALAYGLVHEVS